METEQKQLKRMSKGRRHANLLAAHPDSKPLRSREGGEHGVGSPASEDNVGGRFFNRFIADVPGVA